MSSEALAEKPEVRSRGPEPSGPDRPDAGPWEQCFDLGPGRSTPVSDRGSRHLYWSLAQMLRPVMLDTWALAERRLTALVLGCSEGYLAHRLLDWGAESVLAVDSRAPVIDRARFIREHLGIAPDRLDLRLCTDAEQLGMVGRPYDIAVVDGRPERLGAQPGALEPLTRGAQACALITPDRMAGATALTAAGFAKPTLLEPPADSERRLVAFELNLMLARPATGEAGS